MADKLDNIFEVLISSTVYNWDYGSSIYVIKNGTKYKITFEQDFNYDVEISAYHQVGDEWMPL